MLQAGVLPLGKLPAGKCRQPSERLRCVIKSLELLLPEARWASKPEEGRQPIRRVSSTCLLVWELNGHRRA